MIILRQENSLQINMCKTKTYRHMLSIPSFATMHEDCFHKFFPEHYFNRFHIKPHNLLFYMAPLHHQNNTVIPFHNLSCQSNKPNKLPLVQFPRQYDSVIKTYAHL